MGSRKIICESCRAVMPFEKVKDLDRCPICNALFDEDNGDNVDVIDADGEVEDGLMYFDEIMIFKDTPENNNVRVYCGECGASNMQLIDKFDKLMDKEYVVLSKDVVLICRGCGKEHKPRKILYKRKDHYAPPLPRCPVCNSAMLKKIKTSSKIMAAAAIGAFALPYNSKTFECKDCGYRF